MSLADDLRNAFLTRDLTDEQRRELSEAGQEVYFEPGHELFHEAQPADRLWILLEGRIELTRRIANQTIVLMTMDTPGQWAGGFTAWGDAHAGAGYLASGTAVSTARCLSVPSAELGRLVERWSPFSKHLIAGVFQTVRNIDATARQRESLVALGTLAAGLAHEINNPAAAALRSVEALRATSQYMLDALVGLAEDGVTSEQFIELDRLRAEVQGRQLLDDSSLEAADREEAIGSWLEDRSIEPAWSLAAVFASVGVEPDWFGQVEAVSGHVALGPALRWISSAVGAAGLLTEIGDATHRISHLVDDVKSYSQMDRSALQVVDLHAGIESTLTILRPKLDGIEVIRDFDRSLPELEVYAAELNQVWTNLIDNAIDAMDGVGSLQLLTRAEGRWAVVEIIDSGAGMGDEVQAHAFEPFFTTKDVGKGTGLGLDISRRIVVDRHHGDIGFDSVPGRTVARVRLPITR